MEYEYLPAVGLADAHERIAKGVTWDEFARLVLSVSLHEADRVPAERFCRAAARASHLATRRAGFVGLGHLARRFGACDPITWALVHAAVDDDSVEGVGSDAADDLRTFVVDPPVWKKPVLLIDGERIDRLDDFWAQVSGWLSDGTVLGRGFDAFNDILRGGFGTPDEGFTIRWTHADRSRESLGWAETVRYLEKKLERCHPDNRKRVAADLEATRRGEGSTVFDLLVEVISDHGPGGSEYGDLVDLELIP